MAAFIMIGVGGLYCGYLLGVAVMAWRMGAEPEPPVSVLLPEDAMCRALVKAFRQAGKISIENRIELGDTVLWLESSTDDEAPAGTRLH